MKNLAFFPPMYPEEDFRSVFFRYHIRSGNAYKRDTNRELLGINSQKNTFFIGNLEYLIRKIDDKKYVGINIIEQHTLLPLIFHFIPDNRIQEITEEILHEKGANKASFLVSNSWYSFVTKHVKYCPVCLKDDFDFYGEVYVHRLHQLDFLVCCYKHHALLIDSCPHCDILLSSKDGGLLLTTTNCPNGHELYSEKKCIVNKKDFNTEILYLCK